MTASPAPIRFLTVAHRGRCAVCGCTLGSAASVRCPRCEVSVHQDCAAFVGRCPTYGCRPSAMGRAHRPAPGSSSSLFPELALERGSGWLMLARGLAMVAALATLGLVVGMDRWAPEVGFPVALALVLYVGAFATRFGVEGVGAGEAKARGGTWVAYCCLELGLALVGALVGVPALLLGLGAVLLSGVGEALVLGYPAIWVLSAIDSLVWD